MYECISTTDDGHDYHLSHHWQELKTFFGIIQAYQCINCKKLISKKQFIQGNYHLYDKIDHL
jgi:hypothetical protein